MRFRARILLAFSLIAILAAASFLLLGTFSNAETATRERWPSFVMVYKDWGAHRGPNGTPGYVRAKLDYKDSWHWRSEILEDSVAPSSAGSYTEFSGDTLSGFNAQFNHSASRREPSTAKYAPDDWLLPGKIEFLKTKAGIQVFRTAQPSLGELVMTEQIECDPGSGSCKSPTAQVVTRIQYREDYGIPQGMTVTVDGTLGREITVSEFTLSPPQP